MTTRGTNVGAESRITPESEAEYKSPELISRFPFRQHLESVAIRSDMERFYRSFLHGSVSRNFDSYRGAYVDTGAGFSAYIYPGGDADRLMAVSRLFGTWSFIDDLIDNSLDIQHLTDSITRYRAAVSDQPIAEGVFEAIAEFFSRPDWDPKALAFCRREFHHYIDSTLRLRTSEINQQAIPLPEYLHFRSTNAAMNVCFSFIAYVMPNLTEAFLDAFRLPAFQRAWTHLTEGMGVILDLHADAAIRPEVCRYTHTVRIIQRDAPYPCTWQEAVDRAVALFYDYEAKAEAELAQVATTHPEVVGALGYAQGGTVLWLRVMRGLRYAAIKPLDTPVAQ